MTHIDEASQPASNTPALTIRNLTVGVRNKGAWIRLIDGVTLMLRDGCTTCVVGESGSGKSVTAREILRINGSSTRVLEGSIEFEGTDLVQASDRFMRSIRGSRIAMVFQEPMTSLNPLLMVGEQVAEALRIHRKFGGRQAREAAQDILATVGIRDAAARMRAYPHEFSGGMRQRIMIAIALCCHPRILIADEPTTALDVTNQARVLDLLDDLQCRFGMAVMLVTHDLGVVAERAHDVAVMYAGRIVESGPVSMVFGAPAHPYTIGLLAMVGQLESGEPLVPIPGTAPLPSEHVEGCRFRTRCFRAEAVCTAKVPTLNEFAPGHTVACHLAGAALR